MPNERAQFDYSNSSDTHGYAYTAKEKELSLHQRKDVLISTLEGILHLASKFALDERSKVLIYITQFNSLALPSAPLPLDEPISSYRV